MSKQLVVVVCQCEKVKCRGLSEEVKWETKEEFWNRLMGSIDLVQEMNILFMKKACPECYQ